MNEPAVIREMLFGARAGVLPTIAVVGLSERPDRPSHYVSAYMQAQGYRVYPINPSIESVLGERSYGSLSELPARPDVVNVFRLPRFLPEIVDEMVALGLAQIWVQQGIVHHEAARRAEAAGIRVVMDRCVMVEHRMAHRG